MHHPIGRKGGMLAILFLAAGGGGQAVEEEVAALLRAAPPASDYPEADVIYLRQTSDVTVGAEGDITSRNRQIFKVCHEGGRQHANVMLWFDSSRESLLITQARTIKPDGSVIPVTPEAIRETSPLGSFPMYSSLKATSFSFPAVELNGLLDLTFTRVTRPVIPGEFNLTFTFGGTEPVLEDRTSLTVPAGKEFRMASHNLTVEPQVMASPDGQTQTYVWAVKDIPAVQVEPYMPPLTEIIGRVEVSSLKSWDQIAAWYQGLLQPQLTPNDALKKVVAEVVAGQTSAREKAKALFYWVQANVRYLALEFGKGAYQPHPVTEVLQNRYGDCKDQAALLLALLREAGIPAEFALLKVGPEPLDQSLPSLKEFNHALLRMELDGETLWLDATPEVCPFGDLPLADRGKEAFVLRGEAGAFLATPAYGDAATENTSQSRAELTLQANGDVTGKATVEIRGEATLSYRKGFKYAKPDDVKKSFEQGVAMISARGTLGTYELAELTNLDAPLTFRFEFTAPGWATQAGKFLMFYPRLHQRPSAATPFTRAERGHPIWWEESPLMVEQVEVRLPEGFTLEEIPPDVVLGSPEEGLVVRYQYHLEGNTLQAREEYKYYQTRRPSADYPAVRKLFEQWEEAGKRQVILRAR